MFQELPPPPPPPKKTCFHLPFKITAQISKSLPSYKALLNSLFSACRGVISVCTMLPLLRVAAEAKSDSTLGHWTCWNEVTVLCCNCQMPGSRKRPVRLDVVVPVCGITWRALWVQRLWVPQTWTQIPGDGKGTAKLQNLRYRSLHLLSCCPAPPRPAAPTPATESLFGL